VVVLYHAGIMGFPLPGGVHRFGWIGVDLFFVLSGYLIGGQLLASRIPLSRPASRISVKERGSHGALRSNPASRIPLSGPASRISDPASRIPLARFFARRALRILPAYFVILAIYALLPSWREYPEMFPLWKFLVSVQNIGLRGGTAFSHAWSLAVEDQFYLLLPLVLLCLIRWRRAALIVPCAIVVGGLLLRWFLARQNFVETGVSFRGFQTWIYYATWARLDPLVFGVGLAAIEKFRPGWWQRLMHLAPWLWLPGLALIVYALYLGETEEITVAMSVWQFPLIALGMAALLICAVSPRLPFRRIEIPGIAFIASIAYSAYLIQKLVIHFLAQFCLAHNIAPTSVAALVGVQLCVYAAGTLLFFAVERPFLQLRHRIASRSG
jgi:peptidoglycan/LPS O-acetylase OafA/YrhL